MTEQLPWTVPPLDEWSIVGMNHYHQGGERRLFVAMVRDGFCIQAEGADTSLLWDELRRKVLRKVIGEKSLSDFNVVARP